MLRPWTIVYAESETVRLQCIEKSGPFGEKEALNHFRQTLPEGVTILVVVPGCHKAQVILPQYYMEENKGGRDGFSQDK